MKTPAVCSPIAAALVLAGCATQPTPTLPPSAELRDRISHVAVVAYSDSARVRFEVPNSKADIAAEPSVFSNLARAGENARSTGSIARTHAMDSANAAPFATTAGRLDLPSEPGPYVPIGDVLTLATDAPALVGAAILPEIRRAHGLIVADSEKDVTAARATLDQAAVHLRFEDELRAQVLVALQRKSPTLVAVPVETLPGTPAPSSRLPSRPFQLSSVNTAAESEYRVSPRDADTILEIKVLEPRFDRREAIKDAMGNLQAHGVSGILPDKLARWDAGHDPINPGLSLGVHVRVRLLSALDRHELYYDYLEYRGPQRTFVNWAANDARAFRAEVDRSIAQLSGEIVAQLFVRSENERADPAQLAAAGLHRRSTAPIAPSIAPFWSPLRALPAYAANR